MDTGLHVIQACPPNEGCLAGPSWQDDNGYSVRYTRALLVAQPRCSEDWLRGAILQRLSCLGSGDVAPGSGNASIRVWEYQHHEVFAVSLGAPSHHGHPFGTSGQERAHPQPALVCQRPPIVLKCCKSAVALHRIRQSPRQW